MRPRRAQPGARSSRLPMFTRNTLQEKPIGVLLRLEAPGRPDRATPSGPRKRLDHAWAPARPLRAGSGSTRGSGSARSRVGRPLPSSLIRPCSTGCSWLPRRCVHGPSAGRGPAQLPRLPAPEPATMPQVYRPRKTAHGLESRTFRAASVPSLWSHFTRSLPEAAGAPSLSGGFLYASTLGTRRASWVRQPWPWRHQRRRRPGTMAAFLNHRRDGGRHRCSLT